MIVCSCDVFVQLTYRSVNFEGHSKDYEFSRLSMEEHLAGRVPQCPTNIASSRVGERSSNAEGVFTFDLELDGRE